MLQLIQYIRIKHNSVILKLKFRNFLEDLQTNNDHSPSNFNNQ